VTVMCCGRWMVDQLLSVPVKRHSVGARPAAYVWFRGLPVPVRGVTEVHGQGRKIVPSGFGWIRRTRFEQDTTQAGRGRRERRHREAGSSADSHTESEHRCWFLPTRLFGPSPVSATGFTSRARRSVATVRLTRTGRGRAVHEVPGCRKSKRAAGYEKTSNRPKDAAKTLATSC